MPLRSAGHAELERAELSISEGLLREQAYLVARGVRPIAIVGQCRSSPAVLLRAQTLLDNSSDVGAIPFVVDRGDGCADLGYAGARWAVDLFSWIVKDAQDAIPNEHRNRILGLLFGYSIEAIRLFDDRQAGRVYLDLTASAGSEPS
jgi:hypothetical protein